MLPEMGNYDAKYFPVEKEYARCISSLNNAGVLKFLPGAENLGVTGYDGKEYPIPDHEPVSELFDINRDLVELKMSQGFTRLELVPLAMSLSSFSEILTGNITRHKEDNNIILARRSPADSSITAGVSKEKPVWIWNILKMIMDTDELIYFPSEFSEHHGGYTKQQVVVNLDICAFPGWSVCLAEEDAFLPGKGQSIFLGERQRPEIGLSPKEYMRLLEEQAYFGETGRTIEDFITRFIMRLESTGEVSNDRADNNAMWLLGNYIKHVKHLNSDLVPTGWWHRNYGRLRLDAHRPGNKISTGSWGMSTVVRLHGKSKLLR